MKKYLALMLCLVMALALVACAEKDTDTGDTDLPTNNQPNTAPNTNGGTNGNGSNGSTSGNGSTGNGGTNGVTGGTNGDYTMGDDTLAKSRSRNDVTSPNVGGSIFDRNADGMATWEQMIDNGRVRDTDGFLLDGENASWA